MKKVYKTINSACISVILSSCFGGTPLFIGLFASCPEKPNCISTKNSIPSIPAKPIYFQVTYVNTKQDLLLAIKSFEPAKIKIELDQFIHVEFISKIFRFVDDIEFYLNEPGVIHFRSASRFGYSDLGVNRRRMERVCLAFNNIKENEISKTLNTKSKATIAHPKQNH